MKHRFVTASSTWWAGLAGKMLASSAGKHNGLADLPQRLAGRIVYEQFVNPLEFIVIAEVQNNPTPPALGQLDLDLGAQSHPQLLLQRGDLLIGRPPASSAATSKGSLAIW